MMAAAATQQQQQQQPPPADAPADCPGGPGAANAGKAAPCAGCPNQQACASGQAAAAAGPDPDVAVVDARMRGVGRKLLVLSGKGGVGKSTFSVHLAQRLACAPAAACTAGTAAAAGAGAGAGTVPLLPFVGDDDDDYVGNGAVDDDGDVVPPDARAAVGVLDVDICGPSVPRMLGVEAEQLHRTALGWTPVYSPVRDNLGCVSIGFMLSDPSEAVIWRGPKKNGLIKQFLRDVYWGDASSPSSPSSDSPSSPSEAEAEAAGVDNMLLDFMVVDTPPGTSDEHLSLAQYLKGTMDASKGDGAIIVTTPQEVALADVRKEINFCRKVGLRVLGVVENMSGFVCPKCTTETQIFRPTTGGAEKMCDDMKVPFLGRIPLDPRIARSCDQGKFMLEEFPDSPAATAFEEVFQNVIRSMAGTPLQQQQKEGTTRTGAAKKTDATTTAA